MVKVLKSVFLSGNRLFYIYRNDKQFNIEFQDFEAVDMAVPFFSSYQPDLIIEDISKIDFVTDSHNRVLMQPTESKNDFLNSFDADGYRCFYFSTNDIFVLHIQKLDEKPNQDDEAMFPAEKLELIKSNLSEFLTELNKGMDELESISKNLSFNINNFEDVNKAELKEMQTQEELSANN
jgi:hypothetical protein